jgi:hypothetical protein
MVNAAFAAEERTGSNLGSNLSASEGTPAGPNPHS